MFQSVIVIGIVRCPRNMGLDQYRYAISLQLSSHIDRCDFQFEGISSKEDTIFIERTMNSVCGANEWDEVLQVFDEAIFELNYPPTELFSTLIQSVSVGTCDSMDYYYSSSEKSPISTISFMESSVDRRHRGISICETSHDDNKALRLPDKPARYYSTSIVDAMNSFDSALLYSTLKTLCVENVVIKKRVYSCKETEGWLRSSTFSSLEAFCYFLYVWYMFVPDGVFEASQHRVALNSLPTFVFVSYLRFSGKKLVAGIDLLNTPFHEYPPQVHERVVWNNGYPHDPLDCLIEGSLAIHVDKHGMVTEIEVYLSE